MEYIEWFDTELLKKQTTETVIVLLVILIVTLVVFATGFLSPLATTIFAFLIISAWGFGFYFGTRDVLKRDPTAVGLSVTRIRLLYHEGRRKDILWEEIDGVMGPTSWNPARIVHKNGSFTLLVVPRKIADEVKKYHQMYIANIIRARVMQESKI